MGLLSNLLSKGFSCPRCGQKSPLSGKNAGWTPAPGSTTVFRCATCGHQLETGAPSPGGAAAPAQAFSSPAPRAAEPAPRASDAAPKPEFTPDNSIHMAAEVGDAARVLGFLTRGESPASPDPIGLQPLHYASNKGRMEVMRLLIEHGADPNAQGEQGLAPLHGAAFHGSNEAISFLVDRGANVNIRTGKGFTPLAIARLRNQADAAALLERLGGVE